MEDVQAARRDSAHCQLNPAGQANLSTPPEGAQRARSQGRVRTAQQVPVIPEIRITFAYALLFCLL